MQCLYTKQPLFLGHLSLAAVLYRTSCCSAAMWCHLTLTISLRSHRALSSLRSRIPRTQSSRSSVCTNILGRDAMQFGTAANVHNDSERFDSRMYRNTRPHGVAPQKTAILITPQTSPIYTCADVSHPPAITTSLCSTSLICFRNISDSP